MFNKIHQTRGLIASSLVCFSFVTSNAVLAKEDQDNILQVSANRIEQNVNDTLATVTIISREDIERIQPKSITELLAQVSGFDFVYTGGAGQPASLFVRGSSSDHTLILVDGIRVGSATLGNKNFETIPVAQIEKIEIVKGPRAALWGSDAIGGVIQIFTRRLKQGEYSIQASTGSNGFVATNVSAAFGSDSINNTITASFEQYDGIDVFDDSSATTPDSEPDLDGYQRISAAIRGDYSLSDSTTLDWVLQFDQGDNQFDNSWGANSNEYDNRLLNIRYHFVEGDWISEFSVKQSRDESFSFDSRAALKQGSTFVTERNQLNALTRYQLSDEISFSGGFEKYWEDLEGSQILQFDGSFANFDQQKRNVSALFISSVAKWGNFSTEASIRSDDINTVGSENTFNLSAGYQFLNHYNFSASRAKGFKAPTFNDLYYPNYSNPELQSEVSYNTEFLLKGVWENQSFSIARFDNQVSQLITFVFNPVNFSFLPFNIDQASLKGYEAIYQFRQGKLRHQFSASYVDAIDTSLDAFSGQPKNEQLLRRAKEHYSYELIADLGDFSFYSQVNYSGRRRDNDFSSFPATPVYLKPRVTLNLGFGYQLNQQTELKFKITDFTENDLPSVVNYNVPGREMMLSIIYRHF
ncbi:MAG: TonB-dependent receptor [Enterobacterales bacterium]|nr:TonB-dependent receptor [Enterobacterales bacterium]